MRGKYAARFLGAGVARWCISYNYLVGSIFSLDIAFLAFAQERGAGQRLSKPRPLDVSLPTFQNRPLPIFYI